MPPHIFDSSVWIKLHKETPPVFYVTLWDRLERGISDGEIRSPEEVCTELGQGTDGLEKFLKTKAGLFVPLDAPIQAEVSIVMAECASLSDPDSLRHRADPFVVALAKHYGSSVVSMENPRKDPTGPLKIPDACNHFGLPHLKWFDFLASVGWKI
jgi:hypothetical protein